MTAPSASTTAFIPLLHPDGRATRFRMMMPGRAGRWPVILFSHGANSSSMSYDRLWTVWADRGFVVIGPDHIDTGPPATQTKPPAEGLWASRIADTLLPARAHDSFDGVARDHGVTLAWDAIAVAGHSFGAVVAQSLSGARLTDPLTHRVLPIVTPAIRACLAFSPPGPLAGFVPPDAWSPVRTPTLLQTGDVDILPHFVDDWHTRLTGFAGASDRWTAIGHGVDHYFGGLICRLNPEAAAQRPALDQIAMLSADFLAAYVKHDGRARSALKRRAARGDDGIVSFADVSAPQAANSGSSTAIIAAAATLRIGNREAIARRQILGAALALPLLATRLSAANAQTNPVAYPPSDVVSIIGAKSRAQFRRASTHKGVDPAAVAAAQAYSDGLGGTALLVTIDGRLVYERYAPAFDATTPLKTYSMAKSVMGIAYGIAIDQGILSLDDPIGRHIAEWHGDVRGTITLRQLLQMRSGLKLESLARRAPKAIELMVGRRVTEIALTTPLVETPGAVFEYNNVNSFLAGLALDRALIQAGRGRYTAFLSRALWQPLGQADATLEVEFAPAGEPRFFAGLDACGRDWARIGTLFVQAGRIGGRQIVPKHWITAMTTASPNPSYGLQMWIGQPWTPERHYGANTPSVVPCKEPYLASDLVFFDGAGGQRVYMVPSRRLVIVRTGAATPAWEDSTLPNTILRGI